MENFLGAFAMAFSSLFAVMNPIAMMPFFITATEEASNKTRERIARQASSLAWVIVVIFVFLGNSIFQWFDISMSGFKIFGGLIIITVGWAQIQSRKPPSKRTRVEDDDFDHSIAISPLATPILAGPGTIVTAMNQVEHGGFGTPIAISLAFGLVCILTYLVFRYSSPLSNWMGLNIIQVVSKLMGIIIGVIGTDMLIGGFKMAFGL